MQTPLEIERTYLLSGMPVLPAGAQVVRLSQGYLPPGQTEMEGRIRKAEYADGRTTYRHTIKTGTGLVRTEQERDIDATTFERLWPRTAGRRLTKTRHRVKVGDLTWEIDRFDGLDLALAEVELPSAQIQPAIPDWLQPFVVREVTEEPMYRNYEIARRAGLLDRARDGHAPSSS